MAAIIVTAGNIELGDAKFVEGKSGEALTQLQPVYKKTQGQNAYWRALASGTDEEATVAGLTLTKAAAESKVIVLTSGDIIFGSGIANGVVYFLGPTAGTIVPEADLTTGSRRVLIGFGIGTDTLRLNIDDTGFVLP